MSVPLAMTEFTVFCTPGGQLPRLYIARCELTTLRTTLLLRLPVS
jgi:hypothetical protein